MKYNIILSKNNNWFLNNTVGGLDPIYIGDDETAALMVRDIMNNTEKLIDQIYANSTGLFIKTSNMRNPRPIIKWATPKLPLWPDNNNMVYTILDEFLPKQSIDNWMISVPTYVVVTPDNKLRQEVWAETYSAELKKTGSTILASATADEMLANFDKLFTKKIPL